MLTRETAVHNTTTTADQGSGHCEETASLSTPEVVEMGYIYNDRGLNMIADRGSGH